MYLISFQNKYPLGLHFLNPNKAAEMAQILEDLHSKYVPQTQINGSGDKEILERIIFDGDQLKSSQGTVNGLTLYQNLRWTAWMITTTFADWYLKRMLLGVSNLYVVYHLPTTKDYE